jgi:hypothetical protein
MRGIRPAQHSLAQRNIATHGQKRQQTARLQYIAEMRGTNGGEAMYPVPLDALP